MENFPSVKEYMTTNLVTFKPDDDIRESIEVILRRQISGAPVINNLGTLVGVISEKDCLRVIVDGYYENNPSGFGTVSDFMSRNVKTLQDDVNIVEAAYEFTHSNYRRFPVLNSRGQIVGQLSRSDVLRAISKLHPHKNVVPSSWKGREPHP